MRDRVLERKLKKLDNADRPKKEKVPSYLKSTLPSTKFILQPTDIQKMLPAEDILEKLQQDRVPKKPRKPAKKLRGRKRRRKKKKNPEADWKIEAQEDGEYRVVRQIEERNRGAKEDEGIINLPGVGRFKTCTLYNNDLKGKHGKVGPESLRQIVRGPSRLGGMKEVIRKFDLTPEVQLVGLTEEQRRKVEEKRRRRAAELKEMGYDSDSASDISTTELIAELGNDEAELEEEKKDDGRGDAQPQNNNNNDGEGGDGGADVEAGGGRDLASQTPAPPSGPSGGSARSRSKHNQHRRLVEKHHLSADYMRVEQLILEAENNKVILELAEAARREAITARKKETERLRRKAEERKARMKKNVGKMKKKVSMLKKLIGSFGFSMGKAAFPKSPEGGVEVGEGEDKVGLSSPAPTTPRRTTRSPPVGTSPLSPRRTTRSRSPSTSPKTTVRGGLGSLTQGKLAARVLALKKKGKEDRNITVVGSPKSGGASKITVKASGAARTTVAPHRGSMSSQSASAAANSPKNNIRHNKNLGHRGTFLDERRAQDHGFEDGTLHHYTVEELQSMHRSERLQLQMQKNTDMLLRSESHLRRQTHLLMSDISAEERERLMKAHLAERWLSLLCIGRMANTMARNLRIVRYMREKRSGKATWDSKCPGKKEGEGGDGDDNQEEEDRRQFVQVTAQEVALIKVAVDKILKQARLYLERMYDIRKKIMIKRMARLMKGRIAKYREDMKDRLADMIVHFARNSKFNFAKFSSVISRFRRNILICQRTARAYIKCRRARLEALRKWWADSEKHWIEAWKLKKKVDEVENKAITTPAPRKLRDKLLYTCLNDEMFKYANKLVAHDQRVKESVAMVKQVGINDARAVIQGEVHFLERKKLVLERPNYSLFTTLKESNILQSLIEEAHDKMDAFRKELDRDTGIALLQRADEVLWDLQDEIDQYGDIDHLYDSSSSDEWDSESDGFDVNNLDDDVEYVIFGAAGGKPRGRTRSRAKSGASTDEGRKRTTSGASAGNAGGGGGIVSYSGTGKKRQTLVEGASKHRPSKAQAQEIDAMRRRMTSFLNETIDFTQMS